MSLLAEYDREPGIVKSARLVRDSLYGLQWWLRDAYYWRLKHTGKKSSQKKTTQAEANIPDLLE
jgi:hypothetical protein